MTVSVKHLSLRAAALLAAGCAVLAGAAVDPANETVQSLRQAAERGVRAHVAAAAPAALDARLQVEIGDIDARLRLPRCGVPLEAGLPVGAEIRHRTVVRVACAAPRPWSIQLPAVVETDADVLVLLRPLPRGAEPDPTGVRKARRRVPGLDSAYVADFAELGGLRLRRPLEAGAALARDALEAAPVVRRGQMVTVSSVAGGIEVRATGEALADAAAGQRVRIRNVNSLKIVEGLAVNPGHVRVNP